jgi:hypothetical protein
MATKKTKVPTKEYTLKYQKKDTPGERDPLRRFYTSLLKQKTSPMAFKWCLERGLIPEKKIDKMVLIFKMKDVKIC